jgi:ribosomal protein S18 acetylase RimI-like enzyme
VPADDADLREAARARGFRLVKSRRRKPGGDFGKYGLADLNTGRECLGFGEEGLTATADEIRAFLRSSEAASWKRSLIGVVRESESKSAPPEAPPPPPARPERSRRASALSSKPKGPEKQASPHSNADAAPRGSPPRPLTSAKSRSSSRATPTGRVRGSKASEDKGVTEPLLTIREATRRDAAALAKLVGLPVAALAERLAAAMRAGEPPLLAWTLVRSLQHGETGRITLLLVAEESRRRGLGTRLLAEAERRLGEAGIQTLALDTSIDIDAPAAFLRKTGFARTANGYGKAVRTAGANQE